MLQYWLTGSDLSHFRKLLSLTETCIYYFVLSRENSSLEEIVEKQGDVIEYLQRHNALLSKRLLALTSQQIKS